jgi:alpha-D-ribose 1-methylphosphonate 5-triphosphate diphosphatase
VLNRSAPTRPSETQAEPQALRFVNARLILADRVHDGSLTVRDGLIEAIDGADAGGLVEIDCAGDMLLPGLVDIHTDHFEKHLYPRAHVRWDPIAAALAHDAQMIGAGVTTVFDSICVGSTEKDSERREILRPIVQAMKICRANGMFRADHLFHMRCEIVDPETPAALAEVIDDAAVRVISIMDHTPGDRQSRDLEAWIHRTMKATGRSREAVLALKQEMEERTRGLAERIGAEVVAMAQARGLRLLSHDDATPEHVALAAEHGVHISEFPTTLEAAEAARAAGLGIVAGAPNYARGGSQSGNVAVRDLLERGLVDILASDYVPRAMLDAAFGIAADPTLPYDLPAAIRLVTAAPAAAGGLTDRGTLAPGLRADLLRLRMAAGHPVVVSAWRAGERVA